MSLPFEFIFQIMIVSVLLLKLLPSTIFRTFFLVLNSSFHSHFSLALLGCHLGTQWRHSFPLSPKISCEPTNQSHKMTAFSYWLASGVPQNIKNGTTILSNNPISEYLFLKNENQNLEEILALSHVHLSTYYSQEQKWRNNLNVH